MKKLFLAIFILMTCTCCIKKQWEQLPIHIAIARDSDVVAINQYNEFFGEEVFVVDENGPVTIEYTDIMTRSEGENDGLTTIFGDENGITGAYVEIDLNAGVDRGLCVLGHELGHVLGAEHMGEGIMAFDAPCDGVNISNSFDQTYLDWLQENYGLVPVE